MSTISYPCVQCGRRHDFEPDLAGTWVFCEGCEAAFQVPVPRHLAGSPPKPGNVKFPCDFCTQRYEVSIDRVGRRFQCRKCGASLIVPGAATPPIPAAVVPIPTPSRSAIPAPSPPAARPRALPVAVAYSPSPSRPATEPPRPAPPAPPPVASPLDFLDEPPVPLPRPGARNRDDDILAPTPEVVLPRRAGVSRSRAGRPAGRGLAIGGGVGSVLLTIIGVITQVAVRTSWFHDNPFASNEAKVRGTLDSALAHVREVGTVLAGVHDAGGAMQALPRVREFLPRLNGHVQTLNSYIGMKVSEGFEAQTQAEYMPKFREALERLGRERDRILALADTPQEFRLAFGDTMPGALSGPMPFGIASFRPPPMPHFTPPPMPSIQPPPMPHFTPPPTPTPGLPIQAPTTPHFRRHGRG